MKTLAKIIALVTILASLYGCSTETNYDNCQVCGLAHTPGHLSEMSYELNRLTHGGNGWSASKWRLSLQKMQGSAHRGESATFRRHLWYFIKVNHAENRVCFTKNEILPSYEQEEKEDKSHFWTVEELKNYDSRISTFPNLK